MKRLSLILLALWLFACKQAPPPITEQPMSPEIEAKLYELLKRVPYTSNEYPGLEFFYSNVADIPTHLAPVFGKVDISLLPKTAAFNSYILQYFSDDLLLSENLTQAIHKLSPEEIARYFDVYISAIDNQYFTGEKGEKTSNEEGAVCVPFKQVTYLLKDGVWSKGATFSASKEEEAATLMDNQISYRKGIIAPYENVCQVDNPNELSERIVSLGAYDLEQLHSCDLNEDGQEDHLFSFAEREGVAQAHRRVVILLSGEEMHKYRLLIAPNFSRMVYPLHQIVCKGGYFTFEFKKDKFVVEEYITFKYNKYANNFLLHRIGCINLSMDKENPYREVQLTTKDFGEVFFEYFGEEAFDEIIDRRWSGEEE